MNAKEFFYHVAALRLSEKLGNAGNETERRRAHQLRWELDREILRVGRVLRARGDRLDIELSQLKDIVTQIQQETDKENKK